MSLLVQVKMELTNYTSITKVLNLDGEILEFITEGKQAFLKSYLKNVPELILMNGDYLLSSVDENGDTQITTGRAPELKESSLLNQSLQFTMSSMFDDSYKLFVQNYAEQELRGSEFSQSKLQAIFKILDDSDDYQAINTYSELLYEIDTMVNCLSLLSQSSVPLRNISESADYFNTPVSSKPKEQ